MTIGGFLSEFFAPVSAVAFLITFGKYFSTHWFGIFMPAVIGIEVLLFATTGGVKLGEKAYDETPKVSTPNSDLLAARQRKAAEEQMAQKAEELKNTTSPKHEKASAKKAEKAEKAAAAAAAKKNK